MIYDGVERPRHVVENEEEIQLLFQDDLRHVMLCNYCGALSCRFYGVNSAIRWFHTHDCNHGAVQ